MIGAWAGRQEEEALARGFNEKLIDRVWEVWERDRQAGKAGEFVNLADPDLDDPLYREAWQMIPAYTRDYIYGKFGRGKFMVRRDMIDNTVGYRMPGVRDLWSTGSSIDPEVRKVVRDAATVVAGRNAFPWLVRSEKFWQAGVSTAKHTIVVLSVVVPVANIASNVRQLMGLGVALRDIARGFPSKLVERPKSHSRAEKIEGQGRARMYYNRARPHSARSRHPLRL